MKVLFVCHKMNLGGTEKSLIALLNKLSSRNLDIEVMLLEEGGVLESEIPKDVKITYFEGFNEIKPYIYSSPLQLIKSLVKKGKISKALRHFFTYIKVKIYNDWSYFYSSSTRAINNLGTYDIAIAFAGPSDFISYLVLEKFKAKKKVQWNHFDVKEVIHNPKFGQKYYPYFDQIFSVSKNGKASFDEIFPKFKDKSFVFHNIVDEKALKNAVENSPSYNDEFKGLRIVTLGRLSKEKGQDMIAPVVAKLKNEGYDFRWYLIGDGKLREKIENQIMEYQIEEHLILLGSQLNPYAYLKEADIYVQSSLHEGYCITLKEAKVFNLPVVTTSFLSADNLIVNEEDGLIVEISEDGIYKGVKALLDDEALREKFSVALMSHNDEKEAIDLLLKI